MSVKGSITTSDYLSYDEFRRLVKCLEDDDQWMWVTYCTLSFCLGLRSSDVRKLKWKDVVNQRNVTVTERKTGKTKLIPIGTNTIEKIALLYRKMGERDANSYIFSTEKSNGLPITIGYINKLTKKWKKRYKLNVGNFSTHTFRKTFGRYVFEKRNRSPEALMELNRIFRHATLQTTMIYIGLTDDNIYNVFESISL